MVKLDKKAWQHKNFLTDDSEQSLQEMVQDKMVVFFYPRASTPGCTTESNEFSVAIEAFAAENCAVVGVSMDSLKKQQNFKNKYQMTIELIADVEGKLCEAFAVIKEKKMYGKTFMGIERSTFVLNQQGEILHEWRKVKVNGHVAEVLTKVKSMS